MKREPKAHVMVVEDDAAIRLGVREYLTASGYEVSEAGTCASAQEEFRNSRIDVALVDFQLPDGNALHVLKAFKSLDRDVPVIVLTAHGSIELAVRTIQAGADQFLTKPLDMAAVLAFIEKALEHRRNHRQIVGDQIGALASVKAMHAAGVPVVVGTDGALPGLSVLREVELFHLAGLTPQQAIDAATRVPAKAMGMLDETGTIEAGKRADFLVLNGDPLADIFNIRQGRWVAIAGRLYACDALAVLAGFKAR